MRITDAQTGLLERLCCQRLTSDMFHKDLLPGFVNTQNPNLVEGLNASAWEEDLEGSTAYYIVKSPEGVPLFFFSLKCGGLYQHLDENQIRERKKLYEAAKHILSNPKDEEEKKMAVAILEWFRNGGDLSESEIVDSIRLDMRQKRKLLEILEDDKLRDPNKHIIRVANTHSGVELVHFCKNEAAIDVWRKYGIGQPLGKVVYWYFIVPIIQKVREAVGCKYLFLFAADSTEDGTLINYYNVELNLNRPDDIGVSKPIYDFNCVFMCNEIGELLTCREKFFCNFNPERNEDFV